MVIAVGCLWPLLGNLNKLLFSLKLSIWLAVSKNQIERATMTCQIKIT